jgi:hypothetical protein
LEQHGRADVGIRRNVVDALSLIPERRVKRAVAEVPREEEARVRPLPVEAASDDERTVRLKDKRLGGRPDERTECGANKTPASER